MFLLIPLYFFPFLYMQSLKGPATVSCLSVNTSVVSRPMKRLNVGARMAMFSKVMAHLVQVKKKAQTPPRLGVPEKAQPRLNYKIPGFTPVDPSSSITAIVCACKRHRLTYYCLTYATATVDNKVQ